MCHGDRPTKLVEFNLPERYYQGGYGTANGMSRSKCIEVLRLAFGMTFDEGNAALDPHSEYTRFRCRHDQFARFIIERAKVAPVNGIKDLEIQEVDADPRRAALRRIVEKARAAGVDRFRLAKVWKAMRDEGMALTGEEAMEKVAREGVCDVSGK